jgi:hypothetical protein
MKIFPPVLLALALAALPCFAQEKLTSDESNSIRTFTPTQYIKEVQASPQEGMLVRLKFNGRDASLTPGPDGTKIGHVDCRTMTANYNRVDGIDVQVPPAGLSWFRHVAIFSNEVFDRISVKSYVVYGRIKVDASGTGTVRLIGTEIKHDLDGDSIVWEETPGAP